MEVGGSGYQICEKLRLHAAKSHTKQDSTKELPIDSYFLEGLSEAILLLWGMYLSLFYFV